MSTPFLSTPYITLLDQLLEEPSSSYCAAIWSFHTSHDFPFPNHAFSLTTMNAISADIDLTHFSTFPSYWYHIHDQHIPTTVTSSPLVNIIHHTHASIPFFKCHIKLNLHTDSGANRSIMNDKSILI